MIVRIAQFAPRAGHEETVLHLLQSHLSFTERFAGCRRAYLGTPIHGQHVLVYSEWGDEGDVEGLEAALRSDPQASSDFFSLLGKLAAPPAIARYEVEG